MEYPKEGMLFYPEKEQSMEKHGDHAILKWKEAYLRMWWTIQF